ncbi:hypothetical protein DDB_G0289097 [Dictyostelium discoideum AX4]|uniref:RRM domain-containing protein n=1 Tax=Dictyostelium discoideum TaxID=44689 RepID=Q54I03_DICDI|nr:hypothetical protein DDB_G0289097 [Dictyostelium discoideum AX4]EAL62898.1 hypothetical protein DDB_G0289097 [Dictyostelium discoideum AX4]|eukprot:XP_636402.1 hypothetical protein DDB_G0289097 [Dictyostelium discoideum AX4]
MENKKSPQNDRSYRDSPSNGRQHCDGLRYPYPEDPTRVYVGNLPNISIDQVKQLFINKVGFVEGLFFGREKDYVFLKFQNIDSALKAIKLMNDYSFYGSKLKVQRAYARNGKYQNNSNYNDYFQRRGSRDDSNWNHNEKESMTNGSGIGNGNGTSESYLHPHRHSNSRSRSRSKSRGRSRSRGSGKSDKRSRRSRSRSRSRRSRSKSPPPPPPRRQRSRSRSQSSPRISNLSKKRNRSSTRSRSGGYRKRDSRLSEPVGNSKSIISPTNPRKELSSSHDDFTPRTPPTLSVLERSLFDNESYHNNNNNNINNNNNNINNNINNNNNDHHHNNSNIGNNEQLQQKLLEHFDSQFSSFKSVVDKILENQLKYHNDLLILLKKNSTTAIKQSTSKQPTSVATSTKASPAATTNKPTTAPAVTTDKEKEKEKENEEKKEKEVKNEITTIQPKT